MMYRPECDKKKKRKIPKIFFLVPIIILIGALLAMCFSRKTNDSVICVDYVEAEEEIIENTDELYYEQPAVSKRYADVFCDDNALQLIAAKKNGIDCVFDKRTNFDNHPQLMKINTCAIYKINKLTHSTPYLVPVARILLDDIAILFRQKLQAKYPDADYRIIVTSLLRTTEDVKKLRRRNRNATENSCHRYGTTFDIAYQKYDKLSGRNVNESVLKHILAQSLYELRMQGRCYVKYERRQRCFHITVRSSGISYMTTAEYMELIKRYMLAETGNGKFEILNSGLMSHKDRVSASQENIVPNDNSRSVNNVESDENIAKVETFYGSNYSDIRAPMF